MHCSDCKAELPTVGQMLTKHQRPRGVPLHIVHGVVLNSGENAHQITKQPGFKNTLRLFFNQN